MHIGDTKNSPEAQAIALTNSMASIKPFLSVSKSLNRAVDRCSRVETGVDKHTCEKRVETEGFESGID